MSDQSTNVHEIPEPFRDYAHGESPEKLIMVALLGCMTCIQDLQLRQKKTDSDLIDAMHANILTIKAKMALLGYVDPGSVKFVPFVKE